MSLKICSIASGSKGNCYVVSSEKCNLLVDIGISFKNLKTRIKQTNIDCFPLHAALVTHTHSDHIKGLEQLCKQSSCNIYASVESNKELKEKTNIDDSCFVDVNATFAIRDIEIEPFCTSHDCKGSLGYILKAKNSRIAIATDLGYISKEIFDKLKTCNLVVLESNYDDHMLDNGYYPEFLKDRIRSYKGHLSNCESSATATELVKNGVKTILLAHLSENNNSHELALNTCLNAMNNCNVEIKDVEIAIAPQHEPTKIFYA